MDGEYTWNRWRRYRHWVGLVSFVLLVIAFFELGVFNLPHWRTASHASVSVGSATIGAGLEPTGTQGLYTVVDPDHATVDVPVRGDVHDDDANGWAEVEAVRVVPSDAGDSATTGTTPIADISVSTWANTMDGGGWKDATIGTWYDQTRRLQYSQDVPSSQYLSMRTEQPTNAVRIQFLNKDAVVSFDHVEVNPVVPLNFNPIRVAIVALIAVFLAMFRPGSSLWRIRLDDTQFKQRALIVGFIVVYCAVMLGICLMVKGLRGYDSVSYSSTYNHWFNDRQYGLLGDAIIHGRTWLDLPVDPKLAAMEWPYDVTARKELGANGSVIYWDYAFFQGKYYSYFGVIPALLLFAPYQLITGAFLSNTVAVMVFAALTVIGAVLLTVRIARRYFGNTASLGATLFAATALLMTCNMVYYCFYPTFYSVPMIAALAFAVWGLWFWMGARRPDGSVSPWMVGVGSVLMAAEIGTRPQFVLLWLLAFPIFWQEIVHTRELFSRKGLVATIVALVPFAVIGCAIAAYNYVRFGSFTDFGATYNLTSYDMNGHLPSRFQLPTLLFLQLFQPPIVTTIYPWIQTVDNTVAAPYEPSLGGYFAIMPIALVALLFVMYRKELKARGWWGISWVLAGSSALVLVADLRLSGVNMRYYGDFSLLVSLVMVAMLFVLLDCGRGDGEVEVGTSVAAQPLASSSERSSTRALRLVLVALSLVSAFFMFWGITANNRFGSLITFNPDLYLTIKGWFAGLA